MATRAQNISDALDNIAARIKEVSESANPDYSVGGRSISKGAYLSQLMEALAQLRTQEQTLSGPWEVKTRSVI